MTTGEIDARLVRLFGASWRTTLAGWITVILAIALIFAEEFGITPALAQKLTSAVMILTGGGLVVARDNRVSSERAGANP